MVDSSAPGLLFQIIFFELLMKLIHDMLSRIFMQDAVHGCKVCFAVLPS
jgi:hypothetical protein